ncbi:MAG: N-acetylmuramoyl-L-alanine amidase [Sporomusaceae bacterium]|jgi:hypothetical protein|nr:N-acetylmuramoyl-L-alanine amidase [Sporomusaceae bacterium]
MAQETNLKKIRTLAEQAKTALRSAAKENNRPVCIYLHWSAGHYGQFFDDYHIMVDYDGKIYAMTDDLAEVKSHTWRRNSGAIGVSLACAYNANTNNLGQEAPTAAHLDSLAQTVAVLAMALDLPITADTIMTHAEAAAKDGYGPGSGDPSTRWDLWFLRDGEAHGSGGDNLRQMISDYKNNGKLDWVFA